ncbi:MAG: IclR family transcriptional regulator [Halosimplex sp.]
MSGPDHHVKSDVTAFRIVRALDRLGETRVTDVTTETGIAKSSVYKHLDTLRDLGFVTKSGSTYSLSLRWHEIGHRVRDRRPIYSVARPEVERLARRTGETVSLVVEENGDAVYVHQTRASGDAAGPVHGGDRLPAPVSVGGKAILSYRPESDVESAFSGSQSPADLDRLLSELRSIRSQRMAIERDAPRRDGLSAGAFEGHRHEAGDETPYGGLNSVAVPLRDPDSYAVGAIELSGPTDSLYGRRLEEETTELLVNAAKSVETALAHRESE